MQLQPGPQAAHPRTCTRKFLRSFHPEISKMKSRKVPRSTASDGTNNPYQASGRYGHKELAPIENVRVGGDDELPITADIHPTVPAAPGLHDIPLVIMSSGFLLPSSVYASYASHLASHGYAVIRYDLSEVMDDISTLTALHIVIGTSLRDNRIGSIVDPKLFLLFGHSRGAKLSCLLASQEERVKGLVLLDPVDNTAMATGPGYPSSISGLRRTTQERGLPVLVVGAAMNEDIIPVESNYKLFSNACLGPFWEVDLLGAGHLSFLDRQDEASAFSRMASMFGGRAPSTSDASVSAVTKVAATAWIKEVVYPYAAPSCGHVSVPRPCPPKELERSLYDKIVKIHLPDGKAPRRSTMKGLDKHPVQGAASTSSRSSASSSSGQKSSNRSHSSAGESNQGQNSRDTAMSNSPLCGMPVEELKQLKARDLKSGLSAAGVKCDDCFEKDQLVRRVLEACGRQA